MRGQACARLSLHPFVSGKSLVEPRILKTYNHPVPGRPILSIIQYLETAQRFRYSHSVPHNPAEKCGVDVGKFSAPILGSSNLALTALKVKHATAGRHSDGRGLYLEVQPSGSRSWILRIQFQGVRRDLGLGSVRDVSLLDARIAASDMRRKVRSGIDPSAERRAARQVTPSFEAAARACYETLKAGWKDSRTKIWISSFERHVFPMIGSRAVDKVVSTPSWISRTSKAGSAKRCPCAPFGRACHAKPRSADTMLRWHMPTCRSLCRRSPHCPRRSAATRCD